MLQILKLKGGIAQTAIFLRFDLINMFKRQASYVLIGTLRMLPHKMSL